jgi:hypothetical protein
MKEVTREQFKEIYFKLGGGTATGWGLEYWNEFFEDEKIPGMKYLLEEPETPEHTRMMIVTDYGLNEHRLFFLTEESEESLFDFPDESQDKARHNKSLKPMHTARPDGLPGPTRRLSAEPAKQEATHVPFFSCGQGVWLLWAPLLSFIILGVVVEQYSEGMQSRSAIAWTVAASFVLSAIFAFGLTYHTNHSQPRKEFEIRTGREWFRRPTHSLFWLRSQYWGAGYLLIAFACFFLAPAGR